MGKGRMGMSHSVAAVIAAGGSGTRMGNGDKLLCKIRGKTVIRRTLETFENCSIIDAIILVTRQGVPYESEISGLKKIEKTVTGGGSRQESVYNGVMAAQGYEFVAVHDAARALVTDEEITETVKKAMETGAAITGTQVIDTVKITDKTGVIIDTPDRKILFGAATPQVFRRDILLEGYGQGIEPATDDASLVEKFHNTFVVAGKRENIKITTPFDIALAEVILREREAQNESRNRL